MKIYHKKNFSEGILLTGLGLLLLVTMLLRQSFRPRSVLICTVALLLGLCLLFRSLSKKFAWADRLEELEQTDFIDKGGKEVVPERFDVALSHVSFGALSIAVACGWAPLPVSIPVVILAALGLLRLTENSRMGADAAIAVVSASSLAAGVIVTSLTTGMTTDVDSYMFGSILAMDRSDVALSAGLSAAVLLLFVLFYHKLFAITFDESFSRATGVRVGLYNTFLSVLTALTIVLGMRMMGAMLISSLVIFPALSAMRVRKSFRGVVILAGILSVTCFCAGLTASYLLSTPVGATVVIADLLAFLVCSIVGKK